MKELRTMINEYGKVDSSGRRCAIAMVVKVHGSSYRSPGARMLITDDGRWVGSISGGCLEGDALRKARTVMSSGVPMTVTYDTRESSNQNLGIGLGCNGIIDVLIEPVTQGDANVVSMYQRFVERNVPTALATVYTSDSIRVRTGDRFWMGIDGVHEGTTDSELSKQLLSDLHMCFQSHRSETRDYQTEDGKVSVFLELIQPTISLLIFGAGFDARPVSAMAKSMGWDVSVTDECVAHIAPVFFPNADRLSLCDRTFIERDFNITPFTACLLMSHNYEYDRDVLKKIVGTETPYIGMLGPRKRFEKMRDELGHSGTIFTDDMLRKVHAPVGLDIGAETPDEIALAIIAEIHAKFTSRSGGFLKYKQGPIHERVGDQVFKQVFLADEQTPQEVKRA